MVFAATALWALASNARQHDFVDRAVAAYTRQNPGTPATKALDAMRPKGQQRTERRFIAVVVTCAMRDVT